MSKTTSNILPNSWLLYLSRFVGFAYQWSFKRLETTLQCLKGKFPLILYIVLTRAKAPPSKGMPNF